jgi:hypothetical protein
VKVTISESAFRSIVREALDGRSAESPLVPKQKAPVDPVQVNPEAGEFAMNSMPDPASKAFAPKNKLDLQRGVRDLLDKVPDAVAPDAFDAIRSAVEDHLADTQDDMTMKKTQAQRAPVDGAKQSRIQHEARLRDEIRKIIGTVNEATNASIDEAVTAYIERLVETKAVNEADVAFMRSRPAVVKELPGFQEFLGDFAKRK